MKTLKKIFLQLPILFLLIAIQSCTVDVPDSDTTSPEFSFQISGDGFIHTFNQDSDFGNIQLNLRQDTTYDFIFSGSDQGGVKQIHWQYAHDYVEFVNPIVSPWTQTTTSALSSSINWYGDPTNPLSGAVLNGKIVIEGDNISHQFFFMITDFGGESGDSNATYGALNIYSGDHSTEIITF